jgi:hypothetical protein
MVAEVTDANPNVFLEIGYAWGKEVETLLLVKGEAGDNLEFDIQGQRCLVYKSIKQLEEILADELKQLNPP